MSGEMVPITSIMSRSQFDTLKFMMTGNNGRPMPRWDAGGPDQASNPFNPRILSGEGMAQQAAAYARSQREPKNAASQPVGGRAARQHKLNSSRIADSWGEAEEKAFQKVSHWRWTARDAKGATRCAHTHAFHRLPFVVAGVWFQQHSGGAPNGSPKALRCRVVAANGI